MTKYFTNNFPVINLYKKPSVKSEVVTQMIYGESFSISRKLKKWLKVKIKEDNYKGYIKNKKYSNFLKPTHKVISLKAKIFKFPNRIKKNEITFGSKIKVVENNSKFLKFANGWLKKKDVKPIIYKEKNIFRKITSFKDIRYKWGGKTFKGIDCSALVQVFLNFNNKFCPRDAKDQVKYFKKNIKLKDIKKNDIIYWKGHVAVALSDKKLIHAYGPMKKTVIMNINQTIKKIEQTAKLKVIGIKRL
tara:strand:- start:4937 stop:5674 length:738 start_codon:yes stop_codon:yes gene_type:complete